MTVEESRWVHWRCPHCGTENWDRTDTSAPMCSGAPDCPDPLDFEWDVVLENEVEVPND